MEIVKQTELEARGERSTTGARLWRPASGLGAIAAALFLSVSSWAVADSGHGQCPAPTREQAHTLADSYFEQGAYQRAGACYEAAGEYALANRAYVHAVGPESTVTRQRAAEQGEQAKALLRQVRLALGGDR